MTKKILYVLIFSFIFTLVSYADNNIAVVDLQKIVSSSSQVRILKNEHAIKIEELNKIIENARKEISKENDSSKILSIEDKYTKEFNDSKNRLEDEYNKKLNEIEQNIKDEIAKIAKQNSYDYIFAKSVMLYGGTDITDKILKIIK